MSGPRYSITPGDFATDMRADVNHFRVLNLLGTHTDNAGWCRLKQLHMATSLGLSRCTVNRKLGDLAAWGYIERHAEDATGRAIWYRVLMDRHRPALPPPDDTPDEPDLFSHANGSSGGPSDAAAMPDAHGDEPENGPVATSLHVGCNSSDPAGPVAPAATPGVARRATSGVAPAATHNDPSLNDLSSPPPSSPKSARGGGSDLRGEGDDPPDIRFTARWDRAARDAVLRLYRGDRRHVAVFVARLSGTLHPPSGADGASWVRLVDEKIGGHPPEVLRLLADRVISEQVRDVAAVSRLVGWASAIARDVELEAARALEAERAAAGERAALARLAPGVEPDAAPPRVDALALRRVFVARTPSGAAIDEAWLTDLLVLDRTGYVLRLSVERDYAARYVGSSQMHGQLIDAARHLWPSVRLIDCRSRERGDGRIPHPSSEGERHGQ